MSSPGRHLVSFQIIGQLSDFPDGRGVEVRIGARRLAIFRRGRKLYALKNICPHEGEPLHQMAPQGDAAICVGHGWRFELATGRCTRGHPEARVASYPVKLEGETVSVDVG